MTAIALPNTDLFSVITTGERSRSPAWQALLNWPRFGDDHIDYAADTPARRNLWAARLDEAVMKAERPVLLVASGASCLATAWWARLSPASYVSRVAGALLFTPNGSPADAQHFASPATALPFPSAVIDRERLQARQAERIRTLADGWGSRMLGLADRAEPADAWQAAHAMLLRVTARVVEREMRVAKAFDVIV